MSAAKVRVRFNRPKHYPHPDGPRRSAGAALPIEPDLARLWAQRGIVEVVDEAKGASAKADAADAGGDLAKVAVTQLAQELERVDDPAVIEAAMARDERKTTVNIYAARLAQLAGPEGDTDGDGDAGNADGSEGDGEPTEGEPPQGE